ncbi:hypothetical protein ATY81_07455 [Rhizobium sp. R72]|uniref:hypothetical protein n=1 Tax=unclassified Rhizobium TaxID=2613769 RepID=UPI000B538B8B|nr:MULTISPECIES: hypothetical protein [unclassified Rhizobium]OWV97281.1 hypothetical protein ATY81_07455 [Rhizobium sp. R72]OWV97620.1 hypothetical protein ATY80_07455 [Rhizobium sp. R711]
METDTVTIAGRNDFAQWAIERARAIVAEQGGNLAIAARDMDEKAIAESGNALGAAITEALLEVFDGLMPESD